ncbi:hypothetical protein ABG79_00791 [Caloramator mitchellensis]|uniref:ABC transporter substrate-binding protein n=1 Tax=Caloramator mitchellensis TaxID=908809 RepID=A0A0R3JYS5_CALMK|nr:ABC transporter substrate-binding protein [Caloramator mitchellensis]KRQ87453.1 hypothetical protein ABG79_00791 [Caloramator mitchellensis]
MKKIFVFMLILLNLINFAACSKKISKTDYVLSKDWDAIIKSSKGTTVAFYGWGGDDRINKWIDNYVAKELKQKYDINLKRVPMNIEDILSKMLNEKQFNVDKGTIDIVWINGENFYSAKQNGLLFGPFTNKLPNFQRYIDKESKEVNFDFGFPVEGYEAPYGKAQFVMIYDKSKTKNAPKNYKELLEFVKDNPGKFTYPAPPDFTGSAFVRNIIYEVVGYENIVNVKPEKDEVAKKIKPAMDLLVEMKPYLWRSGKAYPATLAQLDNMFSDGEILMSMNYNPFSVSGKIKDGVFPKTTSSFVFENGTIGNTHFLAIPFNAQNKEGALAVIDFILSVKAQASKYDPQNWGDLPVIDKEKMTTDERKLFESVNIGEGTISQEELLKHRLPELPANLVPIIEEIWEETVLKGE